MSKPIRLNLWIMPNAGFDTRRVMQRELSLFQQEHPGFEVHLTIHPWFFAWDRLVAVAKKRLHKDAPDVVQIGGTWNTTLAALGALTDLSDYLDDIERTDIIRPTWNYCFEPTRSRAFSLPWFVDTRVLYYRTDVLKMLGIPIENVATWAGFREVCEKIRDHRQLRKKFYPLALPGQREGILIHDLAPWIWGSGGQFISLDRKHALFHEKNALSGMDFYFRMMADRLVPIIGRDRLQSGNFFSGHFAFQISGAWPINSAFNAQSPAYHKEVAQNYDVTALPEGPAGPVTFLGGSNLGIVSSTPYPDAAWKLVKFLTNEQSQVRHARKIGMLPSRYTALEKLLAEAPPSVAQAFRNSLRTARTLPCTATLGTVERIIGRASQTLLAALKGDHYSPAMLHEQMIAAAGEADYILSLYE